jgi:stage III sporulation protein AH
MKRKQIIILGLVLVIILVGIIQYNYEGADESSEIDGLVDLTSNYDDQQDGLGAAVYVNNDTDDEEGSVKPIEEVSGYFAEARMERDRSRSKHKEELQSIIEAEESSVTVSSGITPAEAKEMLLEMIKRSETESTIETLIKQRGFEDALTYMSDTGNVDVIVKAESLSSAEVAQISDIVVRHANVEMQNITVKNVN